MEIPKVKKHNRRLENLYGERLKTDKADRRAEPITADDVRRIRQQYFGFLKSELTEGTDD
jgi:hypothetical protein